jgi:protein-S-isoprenylcysteine O-methyltransferase Ste14
MKILATLRFIFAFLVMATFPPAILLWLAIHPCASFWRRRGPAWTYVLLGVPVIGFMVAAWLLRRALLGKDLGTTAFTLIPAIICVAAGLQLNRLRRKQLDFGTLSGIPELSKKLYPGKLLTDGLYGRIRHPRYVEVYLLTFGYALFANYLGVYLLMILSMPLMYFVVLLEERELRQRFGTAYEEYCRRVPRFLPRRRQKRSDDDTKEV